MLGRAASARAAMAAVVVLVLLVLAVPAAAQTTGTLSGRLVTPAGRPAPFVLVVAYDAIPAQPLAAGFTSRQGAFRLTGIATEEVGVRVVGGLRFESGWVGCGDEVVPTFGEACTHTRTDLGDIVIERR